MVLLFWFTHWYGPSYSRGQVLLYRPGFSFVNSWVELEGRFLMAEFSRRDSAFRIASVYGPTGTLSTTNSLPHVWTLLTHLFPRYYVVTLMLFLTEPKIVGAPPTSTFLASRLPGFILCLPVLLFHVLSLITMPFSPASLSLISFLRGSGRWKLNVSILRDPVFLQTVSDFWPRWRSCKPTFSSFQD